MKKKPSQLSFLDSKRSQYSEDSFVEDQTNNNLSSRLSYRPSVMKSGNLEGLSHLDEDDLNHRDQNFSMKSPDPPFKIKSPPVLSPQNGADLKQILERLKKFEELESEVKELRKMMSQQGTKQSVEDSKGLTITENNSHDKKEEYKSERTEAD